MIKISNPLISVIVPVYNVSPYLAYMIDSLIHQSYKKLEILLIDDGSTDDSLDICRYYCSKYSNIKVFSQRNKGVSAARNLGIKNSKGQWISFVDADDVLSKDYYEHFSSCINKKVDMIICRYTREFNKLTSKTGKRNTESAQIYFSNMMNQKAPKYDGYLWNKLFRRKIISNNKISFNSELVIWEDMVFIEQYLKNCQTVLFIDDVLYFYRIRRMSITNSLNKKIDLLRSKDKACNILKTLTNYHQSMFWQILHIQLENKLSLYKQIIVNKLKN